MLFGGATLVSCVAGNQYPVGRLNVGDKMPILSEAIYPCGEEIVDDNVLDSNYRPKGKRLLREFCDDKGSVIKKKFYPITNGNIGRKPSSITIMGNLHDEERVWYTDGVLHNPNGEINLIVVEHKSGKRDCD